MHPVIRTFEGTKWAELTARLMQDTISATLRKQGRCSVMLTGGRTAEQLYLAWAKIPEFRRMTGVRFYFGDERCVPPAHPESNYGMTLRTLFRQGVPLGCAVFRMEADEPNSKDAAIRYGRILPTTIDILLLSVGEDGHIASLFPGSAALQEESLRVVPVIGPKPPRERLTVTPPVIARARSIFVLAIGVVKADILRKALQVPSDSGALPARLVLDATWLLSAN